jgi:cell division protein ZapE
MVETSVAARSAPNADADAPSARYRAGAARGDWDDDPAQHPVLRELDRIHNALLAPPPGRGLLAKLFDREPPVAEPGLYLWGGVGRGKTFLIDLFFEGLPLAKSVAGLPSPHHSLREWCPPASRPGSRLLRGRSDARAPVARKPRVFAPLRGRGTSERASPSSCKCRTHFHRFMREVHAQLRAHAGERDPLAAIVRAWRGRLRVLVLDEFFVSDIGDAMLLSRLLERMFAEGIVLVTSSNIAPSALYRDGLQRARFLPAIALIERHCRVLELVGDTDYRLRVLTRSPVYRAPLDAGSDPWLEERWHALGGDDGHRDASIELEGRRIAVRARTLGMVWFDFTALCEGPRGAADYIEIAREFHTVLLGGVPVMDPRRDDAARRLVTLIDELYDRHVNLVCAADAAPHMLYSGERLADAFARTASRLVEMRSAEYLAREHRG